MLAAAAESKPILATKEYWLGTNVGATKLLT
jgi:hypothetical protein